MKKCVGFILLASTALFSSSATRAQEGAVTVTYPSAGQQEAANQQQMLQQQMLQQQMLQQQAMQMGGGMGVYTPPGAINSQVYGGGVALCGTPPYVYPCAYSGQTQNPYANAPSVPPVSAAQPNATFGLQQGGAAPAATFPLRQGQVIDQSPSSTSNGVGNTAGPITSLPAATQGTYGGGIYTRSDIMNPSSSFYTGQGGPDINVRTKQIRNAAYNVGIQAGFAAEAQNINNALMKYGYSLDNRFDFGPLMEAGGMVVPPVITTITNVVERRSATYLYLTTGAYEIVQPAFVVAKTPVWQDYLFVDGPSPQRPAGIKVKDSKDKQVWSQSAQAGWDRGVREAREQFKAGLNRLTRDYRGMKKYHELAEMGALSLTKVSISRKGGAIYLNGRKAVGESARVRLVVQPRFKSTAKVAKALAADQARTASADVKSKPLKGYFPPAPVKK